MSTEIEQSPIQWEICITTERGRTEYFNGEWYPSEEAAKEALAAYGAPKNAYVTPVRDLPAQYPSY